MRKHKRGFTLIEVILFLAVTTALFVGIAAGVQGSIFQQRYTDSVQNYAEFLRSVYSQVSNVQNESTGRSDKAIYGKVITFREKDDSEWDGQSTRNVIRTYNLIGDVESTQANGMVGSESQGVGQNTMVSCPDNGSVIGRLQCLQASVFKEKGGVYVPVGFVENYTVRWNAEIQRTDKYDAGEYIPYVAIIIVAHSPNSGNISTYIWDSNKDEINEVIKSIESCASNSGCHNGDPFRTSHNSAYLNTGNTENNNSYLKSSNFVSKDIDFCVNPYGYEPSTVRRNIRMSQGAHNASAVDVLTEDTTTGVEQGLTSEYDHNRCE